MFPTGYSRPQSGSMPPELCRRPTQTQEAITPLGESRKSQRTPGQFPKKCASSWWSSGALQQPTLDRYIRGEDVPAAELEQVWKTTTQTGGIWDSPVCAEFYAAVREVNKRLPAGAQLRVLAGDPPTGSGLGRDASAFSVLQEQVLKTHGKALVIYGAGHLLRAVPDPITRITKMLDTGYPGQTFVVITEGGPHPEYQEFERALKTPVRPVLVSFGRPPFRDLLVRAFPGLGLTRGQIADACVYFGMGPEVDVWVSPDR